jgi:hypothetical protein
MSVIAGLLAMFAAVGVTFLLLAPVFFVKKGK